MKNRIQVSSVEIKSLPFRYQGGQITMREINQEPHNIMTMDFSIEKLNLIYRQLDY